MYVSVCFTVFLRVFFLCVCSYMCVCVCVLVRVCMFFLQGGGYVYSCVMFSVCVCSCVCVCSFVFSCAYVFVQFSHSVHVICALVND